MSSENKDQLVDVQQRSTQYKQASQSISLTVLLLLSVVLNVFLARKVQILSKSKGTADALQVGSDVPPIVGHSEDGTEQTLSYANSNLPTVLYVFTPQCVWCKKNLENLHVLINSSGLRYRLVGVSLTTQDLKSYIKDNNLKIPIYTNLDESTIQQYKLIGTPMTIVVSPTSKVLKVWTGVYADNIRQDINKYLQVELPGCCSD